jgi:hypothetical protein
LIGCSAQKSGDWLQKESFSFSIPEKFERKNAPLKFPEKNGCQGQVELNPPKNRFPPKT